MTVDERLGPRLMIYSQDGLGLGHLRRTTLIAGAFLDARPDASVLTVCDSPAGQFFDAAPGHEHLKLPSVRKLGPGDWAPLRLPMPFTDVLAMRAKTIRAAAEGFRPDVLLVDHMPHGAMGELVPTLEVLEEHGVRMVLGLRDILDGPATVRRRWQLEGAFKAVERHFDDVLVYGSRDVFDVASQYGWPDDLGSRLRYCGYVCAPPTSVSRKRVRRRLLKQDPDAKLIVAMAGGGADGYRLFETLLQALPLLLADHRCVLLLVTGPFLPRAERAQLKAAAQGLPVVLRKSVPDSPTYLNAADLTVAMAGYNTTAEILSSGRRALLVPRSGPSAEQRLRAGAFAQRGWIDWLDPDDLDPVTLSSAMARALSQPRRRARTRPDLGGRRRAAAHLLVEDAGTLDLGTDLGVDTDDRAVEA